MRDGGVGSMQMNDKNKFLAAKSICDKANDGRSMPTHRVIKNNCATEKFLKTENLQIEQN